MTENTLVLAQAAVKDKLIRLQGSKADAKKFAADPRTLDKEFWIKHAEDISRTIDQYEAAYTEINNTRSDDH